MTSMTVPHPRPRPDRFGQFALQARTELLALAPHSGRHHGLGPHVYRAVAARGVTVRVIEESALVDAGRPAPAGGSAQRRHLARVPHTLVLVDRSAALLTPRDAGDVTVVVRQPALLDALSILFSTLWRQARPGDDPEPTQRQRDAAVLELLAGGATDESGATTLGVSIRTYRRWVADLMTRLGASSRFQAGLLASLNGWCGASAAPAAPPHCRSSVGWDPRAVRTSDDAAPALAEIPAPVLA